MGCDLAALGRILASNRFRVRPSHWGDCLIDLAFATGNSFVRGLESIFLARKVARVELRDDPVFVLGHWRTGTTLMHELLALDPRHRCPATFECFVPHFLLSERFLKRWSAFALPKSRPSDSMNVGWDSPQEDEFALCLLGVPSPYRTIAFPNHPPQCEAYLEMDALCEAELRRWQSAFLAFLKRLCYRRPGRLVLKSPTHTFRLPILSRMFPRARFVYLVRDPYAVFASTVRLWKSLYWTQGYQKPTCAGLEEYVFRMFLRMHERLQSTRGLVDPERFCVVRYEELAADPVGQMRRVYEHLRLDAFGDVEPALRGYAEAHAGYRPHRHEWTPR
jgi:hypothetical protein